MSLPPPAGLPAQLFRLLPPMRRRGFLRYAGATAGTAALVVAGCAKKDATPATTDVGAGDIGALNLVFALKQVEAAFYAQVVAGSYYTALPTTSATYQILSDLVRHERLHLDFLRSLLASNALRPLTLLPLADKVDVTTLATPAGSARLGIWQAAQQLEDLGVAVCNGAAPYCISAAYLMLLSKIVSVEARHAALVRDLRLAGDASLGAAYFIGPDIIAPDTHQEKVLLPIDLLPTLNAYLAADSQLTAVRLM